MAKAPAVEAEAPEVQNLEAPTAPSYAASVSNIAFDKSPSQKTGALCTGMGYAPDVDPASTTVTQYMGGNTLTIGYHVPTPQ
jgi:hypothetical protein